MIPDEEIREICERVAEALRSAYRRGETDAIERVMRAARSGADEAPLVAPNVYKPMPVRRASERKRRAPKGAVGALVSRVMSETSGPTVAEIKDGAVDDVERAIAPSSIRAHLRTGRDEGRYVERHGRWYRSVEIDLGEEKAVDPPTGPAASSLWSSQEGHH